MKRKRNGLTAAEWRSTLNSFLPPSIDKLPTGGMEVLKPLGMKRLSAAARIRSVVMSTEADVERVRQADEQRKAEQPKPGPEWISQPKQEPKR